MSGLYDWSGLSQPPIPTWWLRLALPMIAQRGLTNTQLAHEANLIAGRRDQLWDHSAISRFRLHARARPIALVHALSAVLGVPSPFWIAPSEAAARAMGVVASTFPPDLTESDPASEPEAKQRRLAKLDAAAEQLMPRRQSAKPIVDADAASAVASIAYGEKQGTQSSPRADRTRARRA